MCGEKTIDVTQRICQLLSERLPSAALQTFAGIGHMGPVESAHAVNEAIFAHLISAEDVVTSITAGKIC